MSKFEPRCCLDCADFVTCERTDKKVFCSKAYDLIHIAIRHLNNRLSSNDVMLAYHLFDEGCKKCEASQKECFKEKS